MQTQRMDLEEAPWPMTPAPEAYYKAPISDYTAQVIEAYGLEMCNAVEDGRDPLQGEQTFEVKQTSTANSQRESDVSPATNEQSDKPRPSDHPLDAIASTVLR